MKKILYALMMLLVLGSTLWIEKASAAKVVFVPIRNYDDWKTFRDEVGRANGQYWVDARLEADITVDGTIGWTESARYRGTFDGNGHTLNVNITGEGHKVRSAAPFRYVGDVTIRDLRVTGKVNGDIHAAGLIGECIGSPTVTLDRVWVSVDVTSASTHAAGIIGHAQAANVYINDTRYDGNIVTNSSNSSITGCIIGWGGEGGWTFHRVYNCTPSNPKANYICFCVDSSSGTGKHWGSNSKSSLTITNTAWSDWKVTYYNKNDQNEVMNLMNGEQNGSWHLVDGKAVPVMNQGSSEGWSKLSGNSYEGYVLHSGNYYVTNDVTFTGGAGVSGLTIASGATVNLYIPKGVTLTARGGNASGRTGAGAGIELPAGSALFLMGNGKVVATGGNAANGENGKNGDNASYDDDSMLPGGGGAGGYGGGGAGAGIGTRGGDGGSGGSGASALRGFSGSQVKSGNSGSSGQNGSSALGMGAIFVEYLNGDKVTIEAKGGSAGAFGQGGACGNGSYLKKPGWSWGNFAISQNTAGGGGGGGGGAGGCSASAIGLGGGGGGGGNVDWKGTSGTRIVGAKGGYGGKNAESDYQANGAEAYYKRDSDSQWDSQPGQGGSGGSGGDRSLPSPIDENYLICYNAVDRFGGSMQNSSSAGFRSNAADAQITLTVPTNYDLGLTDLNKYVLRWNTSKDGRGQTVSADDEYTIGKGTTNFYAEWKQYKDIFPEGSGTQSSPFIIEHGELLSLADYVNACGNTRGLYFRQKSDILIDNILSDAKRDAQWIPIGYDQSFPFEGDYDGGGHMIRKGEIASRVNNQDIFGIGVFGIVLGSIHNLGVEDLKASVSNNSARAGAIAGMLCRRIDRFTNELLQAASMSNCYAANNNINAYYAGGLVGEMQANTSMSHCHESGNYLGTNKWGGMASIIDSDAKLEVCFTASKYSSNGYSGATNSATVDGTKMKSGELTWLLNDRSASSNVVWHQTLGSGADANAYPVLDQDSKRVYSDGENYSNSPLGIYALPGKGTKEDPYQISNYAELKSVANYCKDGNKSTGLYFIQTADIDLKDVMDYKPVGDSRVHAFDGNYDGGGHSIRNGQITSSSPLGIFGYVTGTVNRLCVENTAVTGTTSGVRVGAVAGRLCNNGVISNCLVKGCTLTANVDKGVVGAIVGDVNDNAAIRNCLAVKNKIESNASLGYVCGELLRGTTLEKCYTDGTDLADSKVTWGTITDSYRNVQAATFASGEVCYELNGKKSTNPAWFQNLNRPSAEANDSTPVLSSEHAMVFERDGNYTNDYYDIDRLGKGTKENPYKIKTAQELQQIVESMGIMKRSDFYIEQTADIDMAGKDMVPIGTCTESFSGHYDGQGHTISNINMQNYEGQSMGLFNNISGVVERLGIVNCTFKAVDQINRVGAFAGKMMGNGVLRNCFVAGSTVDFNNIAGVVVGGLVGELTDQSHIDSCYTYKNTILGQYDGNRHYGHVVGYIGSNAAIDLAFTDGAELSADRQSGAGNIVHSEKDVAADRFKTGEICWLLSGSRNESKSTWGQTIRTDSIPMPNSTAHLPVWRHTFEQLVEYTNTDEVPYNTTLYLNPNYDGGGSEKELRIFRNDPRYYVPVVNLQQYAPARKYYYLSSWNTKADGTGTSYAEDAEVTTESPLTLYAIWTPKVPADGTRQVYKLETENTTGKVYDEGGKVSLYDINYNGQLVLRAPSKHIIRLSGTVTTEALGSDGKPRDYLKVYDGDELGDILVNSNAKDGSVFCSTTDGAKEDIGVLMSSSNELTVEFVTDGENNYQGLDLTVTVLPKALRDLGLGTKDAPFRVATAEDLQTVNDYMTRTGDSEIYIVQTADIDLEGAAFTPLASNVESFKGHYDGGGHVVRNLTLPSGTDTASAGLFARVSGTVERLGTENVARIAGSLTGNGMLRYCYALSGALAGDQADGSHIESCFVSPDANITPERFASGEVCYQLNGSKSDDVVWHQTIGTDNLPTLDESHGVVYCHDIFDKKVYTNSATPKYEVHTKEELLAISNKVGDICLMNDLDLGEWKVDRHYQIKGNFDGGGHTISYSGKDAFTGLFYAVTYGASVKHLHVKAKIVSTSNCGGIAYSNNGVISDCHFRGDVTLKKDMSSASLTNFFAGIAAYIKDNGSIDHCSVTGTVKWVQDKKSSQIPVINPNLNKAPNYWTSVSPTDATLYTAQSDSALSVQADYPVYAQGILDVTRPKIVHGDETIPLTSKNLTSLTIRDGERFSCSTEVMVGQITYQRKGTNGAYEPWVLPFDYTIDASMLGTGVEFYRFEKDSVNNIQTVQISADAPYQVEANEPLAFRTTGDTAYDFQMKLEQNGTTQPMTIRIPADGKAAQLESTKDIGRVMVTYDNIPADSTKNAMMYVWNNSENDFTLSDGTQGITPFRYYLQYLDKATGNLEEYEQTDWARKEKKYKGKAQKPVTRKQETQRAALSEMTAQGWQPIFIIPEEPLKVTAEILEEYDILILSDLYDQEAASGTAEQRFDVTLVYELAEEGMELESGIPLLVKARSENAEPLVTDAMVNELKKALTELTASADEEDQNDLLDLLEALHYSYSTFKGEYDLWLMPLPESDNVLNEYGAFVFADKGDDQYFWRVPASDATSLTPMSYCFTAYDARTYDNLPVTNDRIEIVVYTSDDVETGIEEVKAKRADVVSNAYNLQGQKMDGSYRGIVIKNGRKMLKK